MHINNRHGHGLVLFSFVGYYFADTPVNSQYDEIIRGAVVSRLCA